MKALSFWLLATLAVSKVLPAQDLSPVPFAFHLEPGDRASFQSPALRASSMSGVAVLLRIRGAEGGRIDLFQERPGVWPRWAWRNGARIAGGEVRLVGPGGHSSFLILRRPGQGGYDILPTLRWPSESREIEIRPSPARTLWGSDSGAGKSGEFRYFSADSSHDALCETDHRTRWQCLALPVWTPGVLAFCPASSEPRFAEVSTASSGETTLLTDGWAVGIFIDGETSGSPPPSFTLVSPGGGGGQTHAVKPLSSTSLGGALYWVHGSVVADSHLLVRRPGGSGRVSIDELAVRPCGDPLRVALSPSRDVRGSVADRSGKALPGASILALEEEKPRSGENVRSKPVLAASTKADDEGSYVLGELDSHVRRLRACHSRVGCQEKELSPGADVVDFAISPRWQFTGRAVSRSGVPASNAHLRLVPMLESYARATDKLLLVPPEADALTDGSGHFEISAPAPSGYFLEARAATMGTARRRIDVTELTPARTDVGDLILTGEGEFLARLSGVGCSGGFFTVVGPIDAGTVAAIRNFPIEHDVARVELPEGGTWLVQARCADGVRTLSPELLTEVQDLYGQEVRFTVGERVDAPGKGEGRTPR